MNDYRELQRANDEYDRLTGQLVHTATTTCYDPKRRAWIKRTVEYIDIGRPDPVMPSGGNEQLKRESLWRPPVQPNMVAATKANAEHTAKRHAEIERLLIAYIKRNGPCNVQRLAFAAGKGKETVRVHLFEREGRVYCRCTKKGKENIWGLVGIHDREAA